MQHLGLLNGPITLETVLAVLPPDVRTFIEQLLAGSVQPCPANGREPSGIVQ
jgi:hypothetical protein